MKREEVQKNLTKAIKDNKYSGVFISSPRSGKTKAVLDSLLDVKHLKILIIVPRNSIIDSWEFECKKWGYDGELKYIHRNYLHTLDLREFDLIVKDECHKISDREVQLLKQAWKPMLFITGSLSKRKKDFILINFGLKEKFNYSVNDAIDDDVISNYTINVHTCELDNTDRIIEIITNRKHAILTEREAYDYFTVIIDSLADLPSKHLLRMRYAGKRARLIYNSKNKIELCKNLVKKAKRVLVFSSNTTTANEFCKNTFHSLSRDETALEKFKQNKIKKLAVVNMADEGITILNLKHAIIHQLNSVEETAIQRILRVMNYEDGKNAQIDICVIKNTVDENWLKNSLKFVKHEKINYV